MFSLGEPGGVFTPVDTPLAFHRIGYGAMHLTGPMAWGPPMDREVVIDLLREAIRLGINHIDTAQFYGPNVANEIIRDALHPYPGELTIVTKVGIRRGNDKAWIPALSKQELRDAVHANLRQLRLDALHVVNLRVGGPFEPNDTSIDEPLSVLAQLQSEGLIQHIGLSNVSAKQFAQCEQTTRIVCVQNHYNLAHRCDDALIDHLADKGIAFVPYFPLGGIRPIESSILDDLSARLGITSRQLLLAWLLHRAPNILIVVGTSSIHHLRENLAAAAVQLSPHAMNQLDEVAAAATPSQA